MRRMAKEEDVDLIIVGSHGRHGLALIFGSTSNSVLHGAPCDVLAVRIAEDD
jgi:universal stress protein A